MNGRWVFAVTAALAAAACGDNGPAGLQEPRLGFTIDAPTQVESKAVIDVEVRVLNASSVEYPLVVEFEKAYGSLPFVPAGRYFLHNRDDISAVARVPVLVDARIRVTMRESSPVEFSVSKTIAIDVLDAP